MSKLYGVIGVFKNPEEILSAAQLIQQSGYTQVEAFSPFPIKNIDQYLTRSFNPVAGYCLIGGITGGLTGFFMQYYAYVIDYPLNVGGRPYNSWPAFIPITFELTILFAVFFAVISMLVLNGLPKPYHPIFNSKQFSLASGSQFCLCVKSKDKRFNLKDVKDVFTRSHALSVEEVEL